MSPAGGIERVVSRHIWYFLDYAKLGLLTKDSGESFYPLPDNIERINLGYEKKLDTFSFIHRIIQIIKCFIILSNSIKNEIENFNPDIIYCSSPINLIELFFYGFSLKMIIVTEHGSAFAYNKIYRFAKRLLYPKCKLIVVPTKLDYSIYRSWSSNIEYIPNPLPFEQFYKSKLDSNLVLTIGRLTDDKQHLLLLDIWNKVIQYAPGWKLKIIGAGDNLNILLKKINILSLNETVEIVPPKKDIVTEYLNSSIFVLTSRAEGFGMVLAEAMECGVPCIAFNCPSGPQDIITNGEDGYLIKINDVQNFIDCLVRLMKNINLRIIMGNHSKSNIKRFSESLVREKWKNIFLKIANK
jgi:glycosyltransferase involved in cell wall biosynthesis